MVGFFCPPVFYSKKRLVFFIQRFLRLKSRWFFLPTDFLLLKMAGFFYPPVFYSNKAPGFFARAVFTLKNGRIFLSKGFLLLKMPGFYYPAVFETKKVTVLRAGGFEFKIQTKIIRKKAWSLETNPGKQFQRKQRGVNIPRG